MPVVWMSTSTTPCPLIAFSRLVISALAAYIARAVPPRLTDTPMLITALSGVAFWVPSPTTVTVSRGPATVPAPTADWAAAPPAPARTARAVTADAAMAITAPMAISVALAANGPLRMRIDGPSVMKSVDETALRTRRRNKPLLWPAFQSGRGWVGYRALLWGP